jgi:hypothetical protein
MTHSTKMSSMGKNTTIFCASKVSFEFREIPPDAARAKHSRIMKMFANALVRDEQSDEDERIEVNA